MIVVVTPARGGINHVASQVARQLREDGEEVVLYALPDNSDDGVAGPDPADADRDTRQGPAVRAVRAAWQARRQLREADTIHVELGRNSIAAFWFAIATAVLRRRADLVLVAHDVPHVIRFPGAGLLRTAPGWRDIVAYRLVAPVTDRLLVSVLRACVAHTVVLSDQAAAVARAARWPSVHTIVHGAAPPTPGAPPPSQGTHVLMAGFIGPDKGMDVLAAAWQVTRTSLPLVIAGAVSRQARAWADLVRTELDRADSPVRWLGYVDDDAFRDLFASAAVVVVPYASSNPASGVLVRALIEGRAVIATRVPAAVSEVTDDVDGLLVDVGDAAGLGEALNRLLASPALRDRLGSAAARRAGQRHSWRRHVDALKSVYLIDKAGPAPGDAVASSQTAAAADGRTSMPIRAGRGDS